MVEIVRPEPLLLQLNFSELLPEAENPRKIGSRAAILLLAETKDEVTLNEIKGCLEGVNIDPEDFRNRIGIYSETELENLKRELLNKGYLDQEKTRGPYQLTAKGHTLLEVYISLLKLERMVKQYEIDYIDRNRVLLQKIPSLPLTSADLTDELRERILSYKEEYKIQKELAYTPPEGMLDAIDFDYLEDFIQEEDPLPNNLPQFAMEEALEYLFESSVEPIRQQDKKIKEQIELIESKLDVINSDADGELEEVDEVKNLMKKIAERPEPPQPVSELKEEIAETTSLNLPDNWR